MSWRRRVDKTHPAIVAALEAHGWLVLSLARMGKGTPDILAFHPARDVWRLVEVKTPGAVPKVKRARRTTRSYGDLLTAERQAAFRERWPVAIVETIEQVAAL